MIHLKKKMILDVLIVLERNYIYYAYCFHFLERKYNKMLSFLRKKF